MVKSGVKTMPATRQATPGQDISWCGYGALIFDWDGTLADSHAANYQAMAAALGSQSATMEKGWFNLRTGVSTREMATMIGREQHVSLDVEYVVSRRNSEYMKLLSDVREIEPVVRILRQASSMGVKTALATGGGRDTVLPTVAELALQDLFSAIVTREDAEKGKPAPDIFLETARRLGVPPEECLVFEDSDEGLAAADLAGMDSVDVRVLRRPVE